MFELSDVLDITVVGDIGIDKRSAVIIDNFYQNPDEVRSIRGQGNLPISGGMPGNRVYLDTPEIWNVKPIFDELCFDEDIWGRPTDRDKYESSWGSASYMCNFITDDTIKSNPVGLIPHQDTYEKNPYPNQFAVVIYLNSPHECNGGTSMWSYEGQMTISESLDPYLYQVRNESYDTIQSIMDEKFKREHLLEMKYNRAVLYPTDVLHSAELKLGWFNEYPRVAQILFL